MAEEAIVEETHRIRREIAAEFHDDVREFFEYLRQREAEQPDQVVTLERVPPESAVATASGSTAKHDEGRLPSR